MKDKIKVEELDLIIAKVEQLAQAQEDSLNSQQVQEILQELNLPVELLDEAMLQLEKHKALSVKKRRNRWIVMGMILILTGAIAILTLNSQKRQEALAQMKAIDSRITLEEDDGGDLTMINRQNSPRLHFRVTLENTPVGSPLSLGCDWINAQGQIVHQNRYQTRAVDKEIWHTRCRYRIGEASEAGEWQVKMFSGDRILATDIFTIE